MERQRVSTGTKWEEQNGYSRALRAGAMVFVSGTLAADEDGNIVFPDSPYKQTLYALDKAERAMKKLGADRSHVVRTRLYITTMSQGNEVGRAHAEFFGETRPCCTMLGVSSLASPTASVEIELEAIAADA